MSKAIASNGMDDAWVLIENGALNDDAALVVAGSVLLEEPDLVR